MNGKQINKFNTNQSINSKYITNQIKSTSFTPTPIKFDNFNKDNNLYIEENINIKNIKDDLNNNNKTSLTNSLDSIDENSNEVVAKILDTINKNSLSIFYDSESEFKNKIDSLNLKFYLETEKYLCNQNKKVNTQTSLFIILFKQINIYIEEIQRLNLILLTKKYKPENIIKRTDELTQKKKEFQTKEDIIKALKTSQFNMESKLLQAVINENNLNKKIENLQKEIEVYKNKIISLKNNSETQTIKIDKMMSNSFQNRNIPDEFDEINLKITKNKFKNSHNSVCITNSKTNHINKINNIIIDNSVKSKSPGNKNNKEYTLDLKKITNNKSVDINKRNNSENRSKSKINNTHKKEIQIKNKSKYVINTDKIKKHTNKEVICIGSLTNKLNKTEKLTKNNSKVKIDQESNNNTIDLSGNNEDFVHRNNYKKIIINSKNIISKGENLTNRNKKIIINNLENDFTLFNSYLNNNSYNIIKTTKSKIMKSDLDSNKWSNSNYNYLNTIGTENDKEKYENAFNCFKLFKNKQKKNNENNNNINKVINKSILNDLKSKSLLKNKDKSNRNRNKIIINISNSTGVRKSNNDNKIK